MNIAGSVKKRIDRIERLSRDVGVEVFYPLGKAGDICVQFDKLKWGFATLRQTESFLRSVKRGRATLTVNPGL